MSLDGTVVEAVGEGTAPRCFLAMARRSKRSTRYKGDEKGRRVYDGVRVESNRTESCFEKCETER